MTLHDDRFLMSVALMLARRALGRVAPNPAVGCVLAKKEGPDVRIIARAHTSPGGRPHAETQALHLAGDAALGATAYITLEPCAHFGETPPCVEALINAGVNRVVYAMKDPDPRVSGRGYCRLRKAGIEVEEGLLEEEAREINAGYLLHRLETRPLVTLKLATSLDGRIATGDGKSQWISGCASRRRGHLLRANCDGILIGSGCAIKDDPQLTCRLDGMAEYSPQRIVADGRLRLSPESRLAKSAGGLGLWILTRADAPVKRRVALEKQGVRLLDVPTKRGEDYLDMAEALGILAKLNITRLLVEGGAQLATSLVRAGLVDHLEWFHGPALLGCDSLAALSKLGITRVADAPLLRQTARFPVGRDIHNSFILEKV